MSEHNVIFARFIRTLNEIDNPGAAIKAAARNAEAELATIAPPPVHRIGLEREGWDSPPDAA